MAAELWLLPLSFLLVASVYSSVGFGGGSSYLAILALVALPFQEMRLTALICNIIVVTGGTIIYARRQELPFRKLLPIVLASVPLTFAGARLRISEHTFYVYLGLSLILAGLLLLLRQTSGDATSTDSAVPNPIRDMVLGGAIGFLSGMVGIGGGIFLAPILHLVKWDSSKKIAATAGFFILVNSITGVIGQLSSVPEQLNISRIAVLALAVLVGGQIGSRMGATRLNHTMVRRITAVLVLVAGIEVLWKHLSI